MSKADDPTKIPKRKASTSGTLASVNDAVKKIEESSSTKVTFKETKESKEVETQKDDDDFLENLLVNKYVPNCE